MQYTTALKVLMVFMTVTNYRKIVSILNVPLQLKDELDAHQAERRDKEL